ncbi:MAG: segregation/condensation protein A [Candidatus Moranbacteria bacterium]|jgi:segregation and condensation protein A|nr:segregation/condensation protein A [Candidatus Moranbacteria bacterium]MBP9801731.1 segregation/condensation protein A [Candidatus Moranbacteria bacterium]
MGYHFRLDHFEGPLDLLLSLIEREKLDITTVSLAQITDQYLEYLSAEKDVTLENLASFLSVASRLLLIKSRALLPVLTFTEEEEESVDDLEWRLRQYKLFRDAAVTLGTLLATRNESFTRESFLGSQVVFYPPKDFSADDLARHFRSLLGDILPYEKIPEKIVEQVVSLEERIVHLQNHLTERIETSFAEFSHSAKSKTDIIISFLALLELVKQCFLIAEQDEFFQGIRLRRIESASKKE